MEKVCAGMLPEPADLPAGPTWAPARYQTNGIERRLSTVSTGHEGGKKEEEEEEEKNENLG